MKTTERIRGDSSDPGGLLEGATMRLREAVSILDAIDEADLLGELPANRAARRAHQSAVSMLAVLQRELAAVADELDAAIRTHEVIDRAVRSERAR